MRNASISLSSERSERARMPLKTVLSIALTCVLVLFVLITSVAYLRLVEFRSILTELTESSVPTLALSGQIYTQVATLTHLTEDLSRTTNEASQRIAMMEIDKQLKHLQRLALQKDSDPYLTKQLDALALELDELGELVEFKIEITRKLQELQRDMYTTYDALQALGALEANTSKDFETFRWELSLTETMALAGQVDRATRLHEIREIEAQLNDLLNALKTLPDSFSEQSTISAITLLADLRLALISDNGLIETRVEQLRLAGRTKGRGNFLRNLILDYAQNAEIETQQLNRDVIKATQMTAAKVSQQIQIIGIAAFVAVLMIVLIVYFLHVRVVHRLVRLNEHVHNLLDGEQDSVYIGGNDEISDIADTFEVFSQTVSQQNTILHEMSLSDGLTSIANRRAFDERLDVEMASAKRHGWSLSVLIMDVDHFKLYNDNYGHIEGDQCLIKIAKVLKQQVLRETDFVARYGGEEFVCILPDTGAKGARTFAQRLQDAIYTANIPHAHSLVSDRVTLSMGIATHHFTQQSTVSAPELLKFADGALYKAKESGRNRFEVSSVLKNISA